MNSCARNNNNYKDNNNEYESRRITIFERAHLPMLMRWSKLNWKCIMYQPLSAADAAAAGCRSTMLCLLINNNIASNRYISVSSKYANASVRAQPLDCDIFKYININSGELIHLLNNWFYLFWNIDIQIAVRVARRSILSRVRSFFCNSNLCWFFSIVFVFLVEDFIIISVWSTIKIMQSRLSYLRTLLLRIWLQYN